jgi:hypothetical protein
LERMIFLIAILRDEETKIGLMKELAELNRHEEEIEKDYHQ